MDQLDITSRKMPHVGWALANTVCLATGSYMSSLDSGKFTEGLDYASYLHVVTLLADKLLASLENFGRMTRNTEELQADNDTSAESGFHRDDTTCGFSNLSYMDLFRPVCQQWHLKKLLAFEKDASGSGADNLPSSNQQYSRKCGLLDVAYYYSNMLQLFSTLNPLLKSLPVLNMLSFTPGFLFSLWGELEESLFQQKKHIANSKSLYANNISGDISDGDSDGRQKRFGKDTGYKWANLLQKITGKAPTENVCVESVNCHSNFSQTEEDPSDKWDIEALRRGPEGISEDIACLLLLFCSTYSHLLLILDDIEFYEKQVPFTLEQQRKIASMVNTLVYNSLSRGVSPQHRAIVDSAVRCMHLLYERDCRSKFCHPSLWLSPGKNNRMPIAVAARTHEVSSGADGTASSSMGSVITTMPHVFPFEERVKMFREFISMDKVSRRLAGEGTGPGSRSIGVVIRRGHIFEDGLQQLNSLGSRLKSAIHVSFVSESGLPEAGLDYGGLSKEFLTDLSKVAFSAEYGLFCQTSTSDRLLIPNITARFLDNGIQMIEFLGRIVGKALYEGILLDFYFSQVFVQKLLGRYSFLDELSTLDPELYRNLMYVKHYDGDVEDLSLDFTVTEESLGKRHVVELKPGGKNISVTNENKLQYVHAMADYKLNRQILPFSNAFYRGLTDLISPSWLKLFNASEFNQLLSGGDHDIDVEDLRKNTQYTGGYSEGSRTIKLFWERTEMNVEKFGHVSWGDALRPAVFYISSTASCSFVEFELEHKVTEGYFLAPKPYFFSYKKKPYGKVAYLFKHGCFWLVNSNGLGDYSCLIVTMSKSCKKQEEDEKCILMVFAGFEPRERCMLLKFVTSCSRAPLLGFKHLHPAFTVHKVACDAPLWASFGGQDVDQLPSASTCYNTLKVLFVWAYDGSFLRLWDFLMI
ncbi:UNVERIFIED_CONTAM: E3 ubiquitin-protein ligase UPL7 [Sesamum radiatum]|uniref:HECT-type E3 ubiquitin transferase n=1 Tax=Sesamum radiatum TaxID=300843 RepID=A0AAW2NQA7_SESRA